MYLYRRTSLLPQDFSNGFSLIYFKFETDFVS